MEQQKIYDISAHKKSLLHEVIKRIDACDDIKKLQIIYDKLLKLYPDTADKLKELGAEVIEDYNEEEPRIIYP